MFNKISKLSPLVLVLLLTACGNDVTVTTTLNSTRDVEEGAAVYLDEKVVGEVVDVDRAAGQTILKIELGEESSVAVKQNAAVVINRLKANAPIEIYNQKAEAGSVQDGQELKGLDSMFQLGAWMVGDSLDMGADTLTGYVSAFQKYLQGDDWQQDKAQITEQAQQQVQQVATAAEAVVKQASEEVLKVTEDLKQVEGEVAAAVEQIGGELAPVFGELAKSGQTIMQELEKLSSNLEQQGDAEQAVGTQFMQSLEQALEALNDSMEQTLPESKLEPELKAELSPENSEPAPEPSSEKNSEKNSEPSPELSPEPKQQLEQQIESIKTELPAVSEPKVELEKLNTALESDKPVVNVESPVKASEAVVLPPVVPVESALIEVEAEADVVESNSVESNSVAQKSAALSQRAAEVVNDVLEAATEAKQLVPPQAPDVLK